MATAPGNRPLNSKSKEIVYLVSEYFLKNREDSRTPYLEMTAEATGVCRATVARIRREKSETGRLTSPTRAKREPYKSVDSFDQTAIRHKITEFYTVRKQLPTLKTLHSALVADISFPGSVETLRKLLIKLGYRWKKTCDSREGLVERPNIVSQRLSFYARKRELEDWGLDFVYVDETWVDTCYTEKKCWQGERTPGVIPPCNRGQRIIVVHAGNR